MQLQPVKATIIDDDAFRLLAFPFSGPIPKAGTRGVDLLLGFGQLGETSTACLCRGIGGLKSDQRGEGSEHQGESLIGNGPPRIRT